MTLRTNITRSAAITLFPLLSIEGCVDQSDSATVADPIAVNAQAMSSSDLRVQNYDSGTLPPSEAGASGTNGRLARVTDRTRGLWMDMGSQWFALNGQIANVQDFGARGKGETTDAGVAISDRSAIQSAIDSLGTDGGTVYFPPGTYNINPTTAGSTTGLVVGSNVILLGAGSGKTFIQYSQSVDNFVFVAMNGVHMSVRDLAFQSMNDGFPATQIYVRDSSYFDISNVNCWAKQGSTNNKLIGIKIEATVPGAAPPTGFGHIENYIYYSADNSAKTGSRGIVLKGQPGMALPDGGYGPGATVEEIVIDGWGDIENAEVGIEFNNAYHSSLAGSYWIGGGTNEIRFASSQYVHIGGRTHMLYSKGGSCITSGASTGQGCHIWLDALSADNVIDHPSFVTPANNAVLDLGLRTTWLTTGDGTQPTVLPAALHTTGQVNGQLEIGPHLPAAQLSAPSALATFVAPNTNWGVAAQFVADSIGRGVAVVSADFNNTNNVGTQLGISTSQGLYATKYGTQNSAPVKIAMDDLHTTSAGKGLIVKSPNGSKCARIGIDDDAGPTTTIVPCPL